MTSRQLTNPPINILLDHPQHAAFIHRTRILRRQRRAILITRAIQRTLQRVSFPAEQVVAVVGIAGPTHIQQFISFCIYFEGGANVGKVGKIG